MTTSGRELVVGSLFSGIEGFGLGFQRAGFRLAWHAEVDRFCNRVLDTRFEGIPNHGDVTTIDGRKLERPDVLCFGSPCQDLSVAGKQAGLDGARSGLFFEACRIVDECHPTLAIWENVAGAFSSQSGRDFRAVLGTLAELGAMDVAWRVVDSQYFGVPQQRRRIYLVADFGGERAGEILFDAEGCSGHPAPRGQEREGVAGALTSGARGAGRTGDADYNLTVARPLGSNQTGGFRYDLDEDTYAIVPAVTSKWAKGSGGPAGDEAQNLVVIQDAREVDKGQNGIGVAESDVMYTLDTESQHAVAYNLTQITHRENRQRGLVGRAPSLAASAEPPTVVLGRELAVRRLTPLECERLQGFPDGWTCLCDAGADAFACKCPDGPRYRALGNACTVNVTEWVAHRAQEALQRR